MPYDPNPYKYNDNQLNPLENWLANRLNLKREANIGGQGNFGVSPEKTAPIPISREIQPTGTFETATGRRVAPIPLPGQQPAVVPSSNALSRFIQSLRPQKQVSADTNAQPQQTDEFSDYWKKPVVGKMPRDQFVQLMGTVAQSLAPNTWSGRLGGSLAQQAGAAYGERMKREYEAPENALERRLKEAQIRKYEQPEKPSGSDYFEDIEIDPQTETGWKVSRNKITGEGTRIRKLTPLEVQTMVERTPEKLEKPEYSKIGALKEIAETKRKIAEVTKSNTPLTERQASEISQWGRRVSKGELLDEKTRLEYIDALQKQLDALLPYTRTSQENIAYNTPLSVEEIEKNIPREISDLIKSGGEKASEFEIQKQLSPDYVPPADAKMTTPALSTQSKRTEIARRTIDGRTLVKYSDGSIEELK